MVITSSISLITQGNSMKLYYKPRACSLSPHIILSMSELNYEIESVDLKTKVTETGADFLKINPKGQVPCLRLDDNTIVTEGVAIVQYLADLVPEQNLIAPVGDITRYHQIAWLNYISSELHKGFGPFFSNASEEAKKEATEKMKLKFDYVEQQLTTQNFIVGNSFSVADAYLFTVLNWKGVITGLPTYPAIERYLQDIAQLPAVQKALKEEGII